MDFKMIALLVIILVVAMLATKTVFGRAPCPTCRTCGEIPSAATATACPECEICVAQAPCPSCDQPAPVAQSVVDQFALAYKLRAVYLADPTNENGKAAFDEMNRVNNAQGPFPQLPPDRELEDIKKAALSKLPTNDMHLVSYPEMASVLAEVSAEAAKMWEAQRAGEVSRLRIQLADANDRLLALTNTSTKCTTDLSDYETQIANLRTQIGTGQVTLTTCNTNNSSLQSQLAALRAANACGVGAIFGGFELGWRYCNKCSMMRFLGEGRQCPAGGIHSATTGGTHPYEVSIGAQQPTPVTQAGWKKCKTCSGLVWGGHPSGCVGNQAHVFSECGDYNVATGTTSPGGLYQDGFRYCTWCGCLGHSGIAGVCSGNTNKGGPHAWGPTPYYVNRENTTIDRSV